MGLGLLWGYLDKGANRVGCVISNNEEMFAVYLDSRGFVIEALKPTASGATRHVIGHTCSLVEAMHCIFTTGLPHKYAFQVDYRFSDGCRAFCGIEPEIRTGTVAKDLPVIEGGHAGLRKAQLKAYCWGTNEKGDYYILTPNIARGIVEVSVLSKTEVLANRSGKYLNIVGVDNDITCKNRKVRTTDNEGHYNLNIYLNGKDIERAFKLPARDTAPAKPKLEVSEKPKVTTAKKPVVAAVNVGGEAPFKPVAAYSSEWLKSLWTKNAASGTGYWADHYLYCYSYDTFRRGMLIYYGHFGKYASAVSTMDALLNGPGMKVQDIKPCDGLSANRIVKFLTKLHDINAKKDKNTSRKEFIQLLAKGDLRVWFNEYANYAGDEALEKDAASALFYSLAKGVTAGGASAYQYVVPLLKAYSPKADWQNWYKMTDVSAADFKSKRYGTAGYIDSRIGSYLEYMKSFAGSSNSSEVKRWKRGLSKLISENQTLKRGNGIVGERLNDVVVACTASNFGVLDKYRLLCRIAGNGQIISAEDEIPKTDGTDIVSKLCERINQGDEAKYVWYFLQKLFVACSKLIETRVTINNAENSYTYNVFSFLREYSEGKDAHGVVSWAKQTAAKTGAFWGDTLATYVDTKALSLVMDILLLAMQYDTENPKATYRYNHSTHLGYINTNTSKQELCMLSTGQLLRLLMVGNKCNIALSKEALGALAKLRAGIVEEFTIYLRTLVSDYMNGVISKLLPECNKTNKQDTGETANDTCRGMGKYIQFRDMFNMCMQLRYSVLNPVVTVDVTPINQVGPSRKFMHNVDYQPHGVPDICGFKTAEPSENKGYNGLRWIGRVLVAPYAVRKVDGGLMCTALKNAIDATNGVNDMAVVFMRKAYATLEPLNKRSEQGK